VSATDAGLRQVADAFEAFASGHRVPADERWRFLVALDEALSNVVRHGYGGQPGDIEVTFSRADDGVSITVSDLAPAFDPLRAAAPDLAAPLGSRSEGGVGVALVRALMDEVRYERRAGRNVLVITRQVRV
jgi:anti-sigma regulatory factor (Ser/Thr protein kinase)